MYLARVDLMPGEGFKGCMSYFTNILKGVDQTAEKPAFVCPLARWAVGDSRSVPARRPSKADPEERYRQG